MIEIINQFYKESSSSGFPTFLQFITALASFSAVLISCYSLYKTFIQGPNIKINHKNYRKIDLNSFQNIGIRDYFYIINSGSRGGFLDNIIIRKIITNIKIDNANDIINMTFATDVEFPIFLEIGKAQKINFRIMKVNQTTQIPFELKKIQIKIHYFYESRRGLKKRKVKIIYLFNQT